MGHALWSIRLLLVALICLGSWTQKAEARDGELAVHPLALELQVPSDVPLGVTVPLKLILKNTGDQRMEVALGGRPAYDFAITRPDGTEIWRWMHGQAVQQILALIALSPGQELEFTAEWPQRDNAGTPVAAGAYEVRGVLNLEPPGRLATQAALLQIAP